MRIRRFRPAAHSRLRRRRAECNGHGDCRVPCRRDRHPRAWHGVARTLRTFRDRRARVPRSGHPRPPGRWRDPVRPVPHIADCWRNRPIDNPRWPARQARLAAGSGTLRQAPLDWSVQHPVGSGVPRYHMAWSKRMSHLQDRSARISTLTCWTWTSSRHRVRSSQNWNLPCVREGTRRSTWLNRETALPCK